jgi:ATP-dependent Zn protease
MEQAKIDASFMPYVKFEHEYLEHKYGIELQDEMGVEEEEEELTNIAKRLRNIYS